MTPKGRAERDRRLYNLRPGDRERIRKWQAGLDPLTLEPLSDRANCDHRHSDGLVRGLLNPISNKLLAAVERLLGQDVEAGIERLRLYLLCPPASFALGEEVFGLIGRAKIKAKMRYGPDGRREPQPR
jgi:hypothetical protein